MNYPPTTTILDRSRWLARWAFAGNANGGASSDQRGQGGSGRTASGRFGFGARALVTISLAGVLAWRVDWNALLAALADVRWGLWTLALVAYLASQFVSAWRWAGLARALGFDRSYGEFLKLYFEGVFFNQCLPSSIGGDVVKAWRLGRTPHERLLAGATVLGDRLAGLAALLVLAATGAVQERFARPVLSALTLFGCTLLALLFARLTVAAVDRLAGRIGRDSRIGRALVRLEPYRERPAVLDRAIGWSFLVQLLVVLQVGLLGQALSIDVEWTAYLVAAPLVSLLATLPLTIGGVGLREGGVAALLAPHGVAFERGVALGLLWYLVAITSGLLGGGAYLWRRRTLPPSQPEA